MAAQAPERTVVVVDDEPGVLRFVAFALRSRGYQVLEAAGAAEALLVSQKHSGPVHLLLTDVVMPGTDGLSLWQSLKILRPEAKVLFMSGHAGDGLQIDSLLVRKPFSVTDLLRKVEETVRQPGGC